MSNRKTCPYCKKVFSTPQKCRLHIDNNVCIKRTSILNILPPISSSVKPSHYIGIDIENEQYYLEVVEEQNIEIQLNTEMTINNLLEVFVKIHNLGDNTYGSPIDSIVSLNQNNLPGIYDVYNYYNAQSELKQNPNTKDLIKNIYDQLIYVFLFKATKMSSHKIKNERIERDTTDYEIADLARLTIDRGIVSLASREKLKEEVDSHFCSGKFDSIWNKEMNGLYSYTEKKKELITLYISMLSKQRKLKYKTDENLTIEDCINISKKLYDMKSSQTDFKTFKMLLLSQQKL
jgi:hypothetical protein